MKIRQRRRWVWEARSVNGRVYGIQAVATNGGNLDQDELLGVARDLATKAGATP